jgi:hypothetical protein
MGRRERADLFLQSVQGFHAAAARIHIDHNDPADAPGRNPDGEVANASGIEIRKQARRIRRCGIHPVRRQPGMRTLLARRAEQNRQTPLGIARNVFTYALRALSFSDLCVHA